MFKMADMKLHLKCLATEWEREKEFTVRKVERDDFKKIFLLIPQITPLRQYDLYIYKIFCDYLADNSLLLECNGNLIGLAIGFILPKEPDAFFILQFGILKSYRRCNIAVDFFNCFLQQFPGCTRFYFTIRENNSKRKQILRLIHMITRYPCVSIETIDFSYDFSIETDYRYEGKFGIQNFRESLDH